MNIKKSRKVIENEFTMHIVLNKEKKRNQKSRMKRIKKKNTRNMNKQTMNTEKSINSKTGA